VVCSEMVLTVGRIDGTICYFRNQYIWYWCSFPVIKYIPLLGRC